jgi:hypothetical protein
LPYSYIHSMTLRTTQNEVIHLMENDNFDLKRREPTLSVVDKFIRSKEYIGIVSVAIRNQKKDNVISISSIPTLINIIVSCVGLIDLSRTLKNGDMKYFIYGVLYNFIVTEDAGLFEDIAIDTFERMYDGIFDILMMAPDVIDVSKTMCSLVCS